MSLRLRHGVVSGLLVGSAFLAAAGCSSDNKKVVRFVGEAGAGGEAGAAEPAASSGAAQGGAAGGATAASEAGQGGAAEAGAAGAAGTGGSEVGGASAGSSAGGAVASAGTGGGSAGAAASCQPTGSASDVLLIADEVTQKVCRGAAVSNGFSGNTDNTFTCCGVADAGYSVDISGVTNGDGGGSVSMIVPAAAPLGAQSVTLTCAPGPVKYSFDVIVTDTLAPVVTGADSAIFGDEVLHITGSNLSGVSTVNAVPADPAATISGSNCFFNTGDVTDSELSCSFDGIEPGDYLIVVQEQDCGYAVNAPKVTIKPSP